MTLKDGLLKRIFGSLAAVLFAFAAAGCVGPPIDDDGPVDDGDDVIIEDGEDGEDGEDVIVVIIGDDDDEILEDVEDPEFIDEIPV